MISFPTTVGVLRSLPVGRRMLLLLVLYGIAVGVPVVAGQRLYTLIADHNAAAEALARQNAAVAAVTAASGAFEALVETYARTRLPLLGQDLRDKHDILRRAVASVAPTDDTLAQALADVQAAADAAMANQFTMPALGARVENDHLHLSRTLGEIQGLLAVLRHLDSTLPDLGAQVEAVEYLRQDFQVYVRFSTSDDMKHRLAVVREQVALMRAPVVRTVVALLDERLATAQSLLEDLSKTSQRWQGRVLFVDFISLPRLYRATVHLDAVAVARDREARDLLQAATRALVLSLVGVSGAILLVGLLAVGAIVRSIRRPLLDLDADITALSRGLEGQGIRGTEARDELGAMARTLAAFQDNILKLRSLEVEKRESLAREKEETEKALLRLDQANAEIRDLNQKLARENTRLGTELEVSRRLQRMLLPKDDELKAIMALDIAAYMEPADEVGGDYYDVLQRPDGALRIGIGDVTGHGLESGVVMLLVQSAVRALSEQGGSDLSALIATLNGALLTNVHRLGSGKSLSLALIDYFPTDHGGRLVVAGQHETLILCRQDGVIEEVDTVLLGMPLGLVDDITSFLATASLSLAPGDLVALYTDGITEAVSPQGTLYGVDRLRRIIACHKDGSAGAIVEAVLQDLTLFREGLPLLDDVTLVVFKQR